MHDPENRTSKNKVQQVSLIHAAIVEDDSGRPSDAQVCNDNC